MMEALKEQGGRVLESVVNYAELRLRLFTLKSADKGARMASGFLTIVILIIIFMFSMVMISVGTAILISHALNSGWAGYFIVGGFYVVAGIILVALRKKIIFEPLLNSMVHSLAGAELKMEDKLENVQDRIEDKLNLQKQS